MTVHERSDWRCRDRLSVNRDLRFSPIPDCDCGYIGGRYTYCALWPRPPRSCNTVVVHGSSPANWSLDAPGTRRGAVGAPGPAPTGYEQGSYNDNPADATTDPGSRLPHAGPVRAPRHTHTRDTGLCASQSQDLKIKNHERCTHGNMTHDPRNSESTCHHTIARTAQPAVCAVMPVRLWHRYTRTPGHHSR